MESKATHVHPVTTNQDDRPDAQEERQLQGRAPPSRVRVDVTCRSLPRERILGRNDSTEVFEDAQGNTDGVVG